jgi:predicted DNA-binding antitoxin AbrB/MazE fold protein
MSQTVKAIFENGVLRPLQPLCLGELEEVSLVVSSAKAPGAKSAAPASFSTKEELEVLLQEGLDSGAPIEMTSVDWDALRCDIQRELPS